MAKKILAKIISIGTATPNQVVHTSNLISNLSGRISPDLANTLKTLGVEKRNISMLGFEDYLFGKQVSFQVEETTTTLAIQAINKALSSGYLNTSEIGALIAGTNTPSNLLPGLAPEIVAGMPQIFKPDVKIVSIQAMGCSCLLKAVETASWYLNAHPKKKVVVAISEVQSPYAATRLKENYLSFREIKDSSLPITQQGQMKRDSEELIQALLFGDGAVAMVIGLDEHGTLAFGPIHNLTNELSSDRDLLTMKEGGSSHPLISGRPLYSMKSDVPKRGAHYSTQTVRAVLNDPTSPIHDLEYASEYLIHTGSRKILDGVCSQLNLDSNTEKLRRSYQILRDYGNLSSASIGFMIAQGLFSGPAVITSFGVGFSASAGTIFPVSS